MKKLFYLLSGVVLNTLPVGAQTDYLDFFPYCFYDWKQDVNKDKVVDTQDVLQIYEYVAANDGATVNDVVDVNGDGTVDTQDVLSVYENIQDPYLVSLVNRGPAIEVMKNAINMMDYYYVLLNDGVLQLSIFLPTDDNLLTYIDPLSMIRARLTGGAYQMWKFKTNAYGGVDAEIYSMTTDAEGNAVQGDLLREMRGSRANDAVCSRLADVLRNGLIVGADQEIRPDRHYYRTLANTFIRIDTDASGNMTVSGGLQVEQGTPAKVVQTADVVNGRVYITDVHAYTTSQSVSDILSADDDFSTFLDLIDYANMQSSSVTSFSTLRSVNARGNFSYGDGRRLMGNYHYTLYAPTNEAMEKAFAAGLPTIDEYEETTDERAEEIVSIWRDFIRYHVQENAVFVDGVTVTDNFLSAKTNPQTGRPYGMHVEADAGGITVTDGTNQQVKVNTQKAYNQMAREYWGNYGTNTLYTSSLESVATTTIVVHAIDTPLRFSESQFTYSPDNEYTGVKTR